MLEYLREPGDEEVEAYGRLVEQAFRTPAGMREKLKARFTGMQRVIREDGRTLGGLTVYDMHQRFGDRPVRTAGVAAVCVAPTARARGVGHRLMTSALREARELGVPLASLFPSTTAFYRTMGFERAGNRVEYALDARRIGVRARALDVWEADRDTLAAAAEQAAERQAGVLTRDEALWQRLLDDRGDTPVYSYACGADGVVEGTLVYQQTPPRAGGMGYDLAVRELTATTPAALQTWWAFLHDARSLAREVRWFGPASDPRTFTLPDQAWEVRGSLQWMLRIVDLPAAITARGWSGDGRIDLELTDGVLPENAGPWRIVVEGGVGRAERGGSGAIMLDARGLAPLYSGLLSAEAIGGAGLLAGPPGELARASRLFSGPEPWLQDMF